MITFLSFDTEEEALKYASQMKLRIFKIEPVYN